MADIEFRISDGNPFGGKYTLDFADITANDVGDLLAQKGPDLDAILTSTGQPGTRAIAALVWVTRRRGNKGLAYRAVAEHITMAVIEPYEDEVGDAEESAEKPSDPTDSVTT